MSPSTKQDNQAAGKRSWPRFPLVRCHHGMTLGKAKGSSYGWAGQDSCCPHRILALIFSCISWDRFRTVQCNSIWKKIHLTLCIYVSQLWRNKGLNLFANDWSFAFFREINTVEIGYSENRMSSTKPGVTNLFAIAGHFVSYRWVSGPHNFLVIL